MSLFHWTSAKRIRNGQSLPPIPAELLEMILSHLEPSDTFSRRRSAQAFRKLSYVCREFAGRCLPRAFCRLDIMPKPDLLKGDKDWTAFFRAILDGGQMQLELAELVQEVNFSQWSSNHGTSNFVIVAFMTGVFVPGICQLPNLRKLVFNNTDISLRTFKSLYTISTLKELFFSGCTFDEDIIPFLKLPRPFHLKHLHLDYSAVTFLKNKKKVFHAETLETLEIYMDPAKKLGLFLGCDLPSLKSLVLLTGSVLSLDELVQLLSMCPNLTHLHHDLCDEVIIPKNLFSSGFLPYLTSLSGQDGLCPLGLGKALEQLKVTNTEGSSSDFLSLFPEVTTHLASLTLSIGHLAQLWPTFQPGNLSKLKHLQVLPPIPDHPDPFDVIRMILTRFLDLEMDPSVFPSLVYLSLGPPQPFFSSSSTEYGDADIDYIPSFQSLLDPAPIHGLRGYFPQLTDVDCGPIQWHFVHGQWFPAVRLNWRSWVRTHLGYKPGERECPGTWDALLDERDE